MGEQKIRIPPTAKVRSGLVRRQGAAVFTFFIALLIATATLWPLPEAAYQTAETPLTCLLCGEAGLQDILQNIALFLPLGVGLGLLGFGVARGALAGFGFVLLIETLQYTVVPGRDASLSDVLTNTLGAGLGVLLARQLPLLAMPSRAIARRLAVGALLTWCLLWALGAWLVGSGDIRSEPWYVAFPRDVEDTPAFTGEPLSASIDGVPVVPGALDSLPLFVRNAYARDSFAFTVTVRLDQPREERQLVLSVWDRDARSLLTLTRGRGHARLGFYTRSKQLRLRGLRFDLGPWFRAAAGSVVELRVTREGGTVLVSGARAGLPSRQVIRLTPALLWPMMMPRVIRPGIAWEVESMLWVAALLCLTGYWSARGWAGLRLLFPLAVVGAMLLLVPRLMPVAPSSWIAWLMAATGLTAGIAAGLSTLNS